jgi:SAM-dependent methyltransferase
MGLDVNGVRLLLAARARGARFDRTLMIGRQQLNVYPAQLRALLAAAGLPTAAFERPGPECAFAEPFLAALGARDIQSLDVSDFEGARIIHDLNLPLPERLREQFDAVYDGGTLEHVFNLPVALKSCMELLRRDGRLFLHTPANNLCGHGFYQFSPELFFRALSEENGFEIERCIVHVIGPYGRWYEVSDPDRIRERVELITAAPIHMLVQARRKEIKPVFARWPQQSDYTALWQETKASGQLLMPEARPPGALTQWLRRHLPGLARAGHVLKTGVVFLHRMSLRNRRFFRPVPKG